MGLSLKGSGFSFMDPLDLAGGRASSKAAKKAEKAKMAAFDSLEELNTAKMDEAALGQARKNYLDQMTFAKEFSPGAYDAYKKSDEVLGQAFGTASQDIRQVHDTSQRAYDETAAMQPGLADAERIAADQSAELLAQKGALSPEMQSELVRAGLASAAGTGGVLGSTAQRSGMARQLASDQLRIQAQRQTMASNLANQSQAIRSNRNAQLAGVGQQQTAAIDSAARLASYGGDALQSRLPAGYGIGGDTAASNFVANTNLRNQRTLGKAGAKVEGINAQYNASRAPIRMAATAAGAIIGGMAGGPAGAGVGATSGAAMTAG